MNESFLAFLNGMELLLILAGILIMFGAKKLPELARGLGQGIREFKKSTRDVQEELESAIDLDAPRKLPPQAQPRTEQQATVERPNPPSQS
jgi:sec-independent protein translocase protein TatA